MAVGTKTKLRTFATFAANFRPGLQSLVRSPSWPGTCSPQLQMIHCGYPFEFSKTPFQLPKNRRVIPDQTPLHPQSQPKMTSASTIDDCSPATTTARTSVELGKLSTSSRVIVGGLTVPRSMPRCVQYLEASIDSEDVSRPRIDQLDSVSIAYSTTCQLLVISIEAENAEPVQQISMNETTAKGMDAHTHTYTHLHNI